MIPVVTASVQVSGTSATTCRASTNTSAKATRETSVDAHRLVVTLCANASPMMGCPVTSSENGTSRSAGASTPGGIAHVSSPSSDNTSASAPQGPPGGGGGASASSNIPATGSSREGS